MKINDQRLPWWNILLAVAFVSVLVFFSVRYTPLITEFISDTDKFRDFILSYGHKGVLVFVGCQFIQILIPFIPGEVVQIAGGYVYGTFVGSIYMVLGAIIGTVIVFYTARIIGYPIVKIFVKPAKMEKYKVILNSKKAEIIIFVMMLIPGFPKDTLVYIAGLTPIKPIRFIVISIVARMPGLIGCAFIGSSIHHKDYTTVIIMSVITIVIIGLSYIFRKFAFTNNDI
jgi:uncharacterized membrane protein YdjX (TVP38/TMEM64 family)